LINDLIHLAALGAVLALVGYVLLLIVNEVRRFRQSVEIANLQRERLRVQLGLTRDQKRAEEQRVELSWNGFRKFMIISKQHECTDVCSFYLAPHDKKPLPPYHPGQYLTFQIRLPGLQQPVVRCYSLSDSPNHPDYYRVTIRRVLPPTEQPKAPPGLVSNHFHDHLQEGDILDIKAPGGNFFLDAAQQDPIVLIAGGVGLTPLLSMVNAVTESGSRREVWLFYGVRNGLETIQKEHLHRLAAENQNLKLHFCMSQPMPSDRGAEHCHKGRVSVELIKSLLPSNNYRFLICGPSLMMSTISRDLQQWGVPEDNILMEAFGATTIRDTTASAKTRTGAAFQISFTRSNKVCTWKPEAPSLLDFAWENDVKIDSGCRAGNCGTCLTAIKSGEVNYLHQPGIKPEHGSCLTCIAVPKSDLVLDA